MRVLSTVEQRARALAVFRRAADLYRSRAGSLSECLGLAADDLLDIEYAKRVLRGVLWTLDIVGWESHPMRRRAEVWAALKTATRWCTRKRGGWRVGGVDQPSVASVPASRQWLEWLPRSR